MMFSMLMLISAVMFMLIFMLIALLMLMVMEMGLERNIHGKQNLKFPEFTQLHGGRGGGTRHYGTAPERGTRH